MVNITSDSASERHIACSFRHYLEIHHSSSRKEHRVASENEANRIFDKEQDVLLKTRRRRSRSNKRVLIVVRKKGGVWELVFVLPDLVCGCLADL